MPRYVLLYISAKTAGTIHNGLAPKTPAKKRQMTNVCASFAVADPMVKMEEPSMPMVRGQRRPMSSEPGAQIMGPKVNPKTKRLVPRMPTSALTWNAALA